MLDETQFATSDATALAQEIHSGHVTTTDLVKLAAAATYPGAHGFEFVEFDGRPGGTAAGQARSRRRCGPRQSIGASSLAAIGQALSRRVLRLLGLPASVSGYGTLRSTSAETR